MFTFVCMNLVWSIMNTTFHITHVLIKSIFFEETNLSFKVTLRLRHGSLKNKSFMLHKGCYAHNGSLVRDIKSLTIAYFKMSQSVICH